MESVKILVTLDKNYLLPLQVMLTSLHYNNPGEKIEIYLIHKNIPDLELDRVREQCIRLHFDFFPTRMRGEDFQNAPVTKQYPQEMYYRLLAPCLLPRHLDRILYLDPDTLIIDPIRALWETANPAPRVHFRFFLSVHLYSKDWAGTVHRRPDPNPVVYRI